jgi:predicted ribosome quality control (RQC) complex YloA/Tae2 family protein
MNELIIQYREQCQKAIRDYESIFNEDKNMSLRRSKDIVAVKEILNRSWKEVNACITSIKTYLESMETGWWIFKTGDSRLKNNLTKVIHSYEDPVAQSLLKYSSLVQSKLEEALQCIEKIDISKTPSDLLDEKNRHIQSLEQTLSQQKKEIEALIKKNHELSKKVIESKREGQSSSSRLITSKEQDEELRILVEL